MFHVFKKERKMKNKDGKGWKEGNGEEDKKGEMKGRREGRNGPRNQVLAELQVEVHLSTWPRTDVI